MTRGVATHWPFVALFLACKTTVAFAEAPAEQIALDAAIEAWELAYIARNADAMVALTTEDFVLLPPNSAAVRGREAAEAEWRRMRSSDVVQISIDGEETVIDGNLAYQIGSYAHTLSNNRVLMQGMYIDIWKRIDGEWRIHRHSYSAVGAAPGRELVPAPVKNEPRLDSPDSQ